MSSVKIKRACVGEDDDGNPSMAVTEVEYRLWDKNTALANLAKHLGMFDGSPEEVKERLFEFFMGSQ